MPARFLCLTLVGCTVASDTTGSACGREKCDTVPPPAFELKGGIYALAIAGRSLAQPTNDKIRVLHVEGSANAFTATVDEDLSELARGLLGDSTDFGLTDIAYDQAEQQLCLLASNWAITCFSPNGGSPRSVSLQSSVYGNVAAGLGRGLGGLAVIGGFGDLFETSSETLSVTTKFSVAGDIDTSDTYGLVVSASDGLYQYQKGQFVNVYKQPDPQSLPGLTWHDDAKLLVVASTSELFTISIDDNTSPPTLKRETATCTTTDGQPCADHFSFLGLAYVPTQPLS